MAHPALSRRAFLAATGVLAAGRVRLRSAPPTERQRTRLVLLGTAGGLTPKLRRAAPAQAIIAGDRVYLVDCGDGVARQMTLARLPFRQLRAVFITHQHSDHNAGYGPSFLLGRTSGLDAALDAYGPPPMTGMTRALFELARGADVLVHEALYRPFWVRPDAPQPPAVVRHILASHTAVEDVGRLAAAAGVKTHVLTHVVPSDKPDAVTDDQWLAAATRHFKGEVVLGQDLMEIG